MSVSVDTVLKEQKPVLRQLLELYEYDFTAYNDVDVDDTGHFGYTYLDHYWTEDKYAPFFIRANGKLAGFVLVNNYCHCIDEDAYAIAEFFVMKKYRKHGVGRLAAHTVFDHFHGLWEVDTHPNNARARAFWERVIGEYTGDNFRSVPVDNGRWTGTAYLFDNSAKSKEE